jgi:hypothetical protein
MSHQVCWWHPGQRIQWLCLRPGIHTEMLSRRTPRSSSVTRDRVAQAEQVTTTVP